MSWTDKASIEHIKKLRDIFKIDDFVETGTHTGINAKLHSPNFLNVFTCDIKDQGRISQHARPNVLFLQEKSTDFLTRFRGTKAIYYLDAHFYDKKLKQKFVVLDELKAMGKNENAIIIIHDFDNGLGHITYDGISLDMKLLKKSLLKVNKNFKFYTNELSSCDIKKLEEAESMDEFDNLKYVWSKPEKTYRGILYCVPKKVKIDGLKLIE